jgi:hypothetical protein
MFAVRSTVKEQSTELGWTVSMLNRETDSYVMHCRKYWGDLKSSRKHTWVSLTSTAYRQMERERTTHDERLIRLRTEDHEKWLD